MIVITATELSMKGEWQAASSAPFDREVELAVIDYKGVHALVFPCRRTLNGWIEAASKCPIRVRPTHWREWNSTPRRLGAIARSEKPRKAP